ncbi:OmpA family protein [Paracrocinitomix mangrovi]|uniref:OmpA/MotB family protein n=1 Tax=Paracrocinitomix mangrovi TaxID=2862509 RepID=UPI001C8D68BE|nr:OmpA family protein [Paracrocinitomix mangrovi]UKN00400.1 OmpA family protein [Paracrocinitomix mangrovi]
MKKIVYITFVSLLAVACVPAKKYKELEAKYNKCQEDQASYKSQSIEYGNRLKEVEVELSTLKDAYEQLTSDTTKMMNDYRMLQTEYDRKVQSCSDLEKRYEKMMASGSQDMQKLVGDLEDTRVELQKKEDRLNKLEQDLIAREKAIKAKEERIEELEKVIKMQEKIVADLKAKITEALRGFADKGITVVEKDGKIYVSMEAKLLFPSGSTVVNNEGKGVLIDLAKVLQDQTELDIIVEGHTDSDPMKSSAHPKNNWELSVLRSTAVVEIMLGNSHMDPAKITAAGRSEFHPVDPDDKAKNRRIEIIISPDLKPLFDLISQSSE